MFAYIRGHLNTKASLIIILIAVAVFTALVTVSTLWQKSSMYEQLDQTLTRTAELIYQAVSKPMVVGNDSATSEAFARLAEQYPDTVIQLTNHAGNITYSTHEQDLRKDFAAIHKQPELVAFMDRSLQAQVDEGLQVDTAGKHVFVRAMTIPNAPACYHCHGRKLKVLGSMLVMQDVTGQVEHINTQTYEFIAICVVGLILLVVPVIFFLRRTVLAPVSSIASAAKTVLDGDFSAAFDVPGTDELGQLSKHLGAMVGNLKTQLGFAQGVLNGLTLPCGIVGPDHKILWVNQLMCDLLEKPDAPDAYVGVSSGQFFRNDESKETLSDKAVTQRTFLEHELKHTTKAGEEKFFHISTTPFFDMDDNLLGALSLWVDLTDIRRQQQLIQAQNERIAVAADKANEVSGQLSTASDELTAQIDEANRGSEVQRARAAETATAMEEMNVTVLAVARNAGDAAVDADTARDQANVGAGIVGNVIDAIADVQQKADGLRVSMEELGEQAANIGTVMTVITDIADQTNLLALNAAIEAARAGDAGRGFAVVADEVRKLAEKTMAATKEVGDAISGMQNVASTNVAATESAVESVSRSTELANQSGAILQEIVGLVDNVADQVRSIATAAEQQSATSDEINRATEEINQVATANSEVMNQSAEAVLEVARMAATLNDIINDMQAG